MLESFTEHLVDAIAQNQILSTQPTSHLTIFDVALVDVSTEETLHANINDNFLGNTKRCCELAIYYAKEFNPNSINPYQVLLEYLIQYKTSGIQTEFGLIYRTVKEAKQIQTALYWSHILGAAMVDQKIKDIMLPLLDQRIRDIYWV